MIDAPGPLRAATRSFIASLPHPDRFALAGSAQVGAETTNAIVALGRAFGYSRDIVVRSMPLSLPKLHPFPTMNHEHGCIFELAGERSVEIVLNSNAFGFGNIGLLVGRLPVLVWLFGTILERKPDLTAQVTCLLGDVSWWPIVSFSSSDPQACLIPDSEFFATGGYSEFRASMEERMPPWDERISKVFWRGSTTGIKRYWPPLAPDDLHWLPRLELCMLANSPSLADICDIGITGLVQTAPDLQPVIARAAASFVRSPVEKTVFAGFKAVVDIDGNANAWSGLFTSLLTGSCVIKVESEHGLRQWYYDRLVPWVHYVPVRSDLSNFGTVVEGLLHDDATARRIGGAGRRFAEGLDFEIALSDAANRLLTWISPNGSVRSAGKEPSECAGNLKRLDCSTKSSGRRDAICTGEASLGSADHEA